MITGVVPAGASPSTTTGDSDSDTGAGSVGGRGCSATDSGPVGGGGGRIRPRANMVVLYLAAGAVEPIFAATQTSNCCCILDMSACSECCAGGCHCSGLFLYFDFKSGESIHSPANVGSTDGSSLVTNCFIAPFSLAPFKPLHDLMKANLLFLSILCQTLDTLPCLKWYWTRLYIV